MLKLGVQLEKEALERSRQERLAILNFQQSRANRIAMLVGEDKVSVPVSLSLLNRITKIEGENCALANSMM